MDKEKVIGCAEKILQVTFYGGVAFPCYWPNFGTDAFFTYMDAEIEFSSVFLPAYAPFHPKGGTPVFWARWNNSILKNYSDLSVIQIKEDNFYRAKDQGFHLLCHGALARELLCWSNRYSPKHRFLSGAKEKSPAGMC